MFSMKAECFYPQLYWYSGGGRRGGCCPLTQASIRSFSTSGLSVNVTSRGLTSVPRSMTSWWSRITWFVIVCYLHWRLQFGEGRDPLTPVFSLTSLHDRHLSSSRGGVGRTGWGKRLGFKISHKKAIWYNLTDASCKPLLPKLQELLTQ